MVAAFTKAQLGVSQNSATPGNIPSGALVGAIYSHDDAQDVFLVSWKVESLSLAYECARVRVLFRARVSAQADPSARVWLGRAALEASPGLIRAYFASIKED
jgi:hypothetical protein